MGVKFAKNAPADGHRKIEEYFSIPQQHATNKGLRSLSGGSGVKAGEAIQIWSVGLNDAESKPIETSAVPGEWSYIIYDSDDVAAEAQVTGGAGGQSEVTAVSYGQHVPGIVKALGVGNSNFIKADVEPRILNVPSVGFLGLWLHGKGEEDSVIPLSKDYSSKNFQVVKMKQIESQIQSKAKAVKAGIAANPGPSGGAGAGLVDTTENLVIPDFLKLFELNLMPSAGATLAKKTLPFTMQSQQQTNWCWAAVGTSVGLFFETGSWTQCDTATGCLGGGKDCCKNPGPCNVYGFLDQSLTYTKSFDSMTSSTTPLSEIEQKINSNKPVCTRVAWNGGGAHFMAITGYDGSKIVIQDSIYGTTVMNYSSYPASYKGGGSWTHSYYCKPS